MEAVLGTLVELREKSLAEAGRLGYETYRHITLPRRSVPYCRWPTQSSTTPLLTRPEAEEHGMEQNCFA